jgi:protein-disulfide isomerase
MKYLLVGGTCLLLILAFVVGSSYYRDQQVKKFDFMAQENAELFVRDHSQTLGSPEAKVHLVEFMDPACETCAAFSPFVKMLMARHPGRIRLILRYAPFHDGADGFVAIVEAAKKQGKYWETLDAMFKSQPYWASHSHPQPQRLWEFLPKDLDLAQLRRDMQDPEIARIIAQDMADAKALNVQKTPGYFVNGKPLQTFGYRELQALIEAELKIVYPDAY